MPTPLHQLKADFFKTLGHPARIRVLELLSEGEQAVGEMLGPVGIEPAHLSQQLAVLRRAGLVQTRKQGSTVYYSVTSPRVAELLDVARRILATVLTEQTGLLAELHADHADHADDAAGKDDTAGRAGTGRRTGRTGADGTKGRTSADGTEGRTAAAPRRSTRA